MAQRAQRLTIGFPSHPLRRHPGEEVEKAPDVVGEKQRHDHNPRPAVHRVEIGIELIVVVLNRERGGGGTERGVQHGRKMEKERRDGVHEKDSLRGLSGEGALGGRG